MPANKTAPTEDDVTTFLKALEPEARQTDALRLDEIFRDVTGFIPKMWGPSIIGYGRYHYTYKSGREGDSLATGFSPRAREFSIYIMPGYAEFDSILSRLGKHKIGKSCLYVKRLSDINENVLKELIRAGLDDLATRWDVHPDVQDMDKSRHL